MCQVHFRDLCLGYEPPEAIRAEVETLAVEHAGIDREARTISLRLSSGVYITEALLSQMASELEARYGLRRLELSVQYPPEALASFDYRDLYRVFVKAYSCLLYTSHRNVPFDGQPYSRAGLCAQGDVYKRQSHRRPACVRRAGARE